MNKVVTTHGIVIRMPFPIDNAELFHGIVDLIPKRVRVFAHAGSDGLVETVTSRQDNVGGNQGPTAKVIERDKVGIAVLLSGLAIDYH